MSVLKKSLLIGFIGLFGLIGCNQEESKLDALKKIESTRKLRVAVDANTGFPFVHFNRDIEAYGGFEYDVAEYIAQKFNAKLEILPTSWEELLPVLKEGKADIVLNGIEEPEKHDKKSNFLFSKPYYVSHQQIMVPKSDNFTYNLSDLDKKKVGVIQSSAASAMLDELNRLKGTKISLIHYPKPEPMFSALGEGDIDALLTERAIGSWFSWQNEKVKNTGEKILEHSYVVAMRETDTRLFRRLNYILEQAPEDKAFKAIEKKWHLQ